jgi:hypothetical protein
MSCNIRVYESKDDNLYLTAILGSKEDRCMIRFTIKNHYCQLGEAALLDLIATIAKRLGYKEGYTATGYERDDLTYPAARNEV